MGDISKNFSRSEMDCPCDCGFSTADVELIEVLEGVRARFGDRSVTISSGCRCDQYNKRIGGAKHSKHKLGIAADIVIHGVDPKDVYESLDKHNPNRFGLGNYDTFTHVDVRPNRARWNQVKVDN
jgi:uncharacterized protein YcbK (DUF882 family)